MINNLSSVNQRKSHHNDRSCGSVDSNTGASNLSKNANNNEDSGIHKPLSDLSQESQSRSQLQSKSQDDLKKFSAADEHSRDTFKQAATNSTSMSVTSKNITTASYLNQNNQFITSQPIPTQKLFGADAQANNQYEPKAGIEELERRLNELESSASKANVTILQTMFTAARPEPSFGSETSAKQSSPNKRTTKASPQKSQNNSEISVEKPVSASENSKNTSQQPKFDSDNYYQQSENTSHSQRENKKKAKRQQKKRNNNNDHDNDNKNDELQPALEEGEGEGEVEGKREGEEVLQNQNQSQNHSENQSQSNTQTQEVEVTFEVMKQSSSDETNLADQLQASSASFSQKDRPQDSYSEETANQPGDLRSQFTSGSNEANEKRSSSNFGQPASPEKNSSAQGQNYSESPSRQNKIQNTNARKVENSHEENPTSFQQQQEESEYFQGSNVSTQKSVQNKNKSQSQKSKKSQKQPEYEQEEAGSSSRREHQYQGQSQNSERESARDNESPLSYENPSTNSHHHNPFYPGNSNLEKQPSRKPNFNLDISSQGQSQNSQSQEAPSYNYQPHQAPQKKYENSPVKNAKPYLPTSQHHEEENSLENNDKEEISQVLSVYSKRENNQTRNELNDSHHQGSDRGGSGTNQSHNKFSQENVHNFKNSFEKMGKQETPTHFEIGKSELSELRLSRMSEEQAASLYEQRKNDIQKSIQKISKNKKKAVQSTPKNQQQNQQPTTPVQIMAREQVPLTKKKVNPSEAQSDSTTQNPPPPSRERAIKKSKPQPRNQLSPKPEQTNPTPTTAATVMTEEKIEKAQPKKKASELKLKATVHVNPNANADAHPKQQNSHRQRQQQEQISDNKDPIQIARESILQRMENIEKALVKTDGSEERGAPQQLRSTTGKKTNPRNSESNNEPRYSSQNRQNIQANSNSKLNTHTDPGYEHTTENSNAPTPSKQGGYSQLQRANKLKQSATSEYSQEDERVSRNATRNEDKDSKIKVETLNLRSTINKRNTNGTSSQAASHRQYTPAATAAENNNTSSINNNRNNRNKAAAPEKELPKAQGPQINYSEIPQNSKYNPLSPQKSLDVTQTQDKQTLSRENSLSVKRSTGGFQSRLNFSKNNNASQLNNNKKIQNQDKNQRAVSASPDYLENNYSRFYSRDTSFEERNRLWVIKKNQNLAENERKQYLEEKSVCTFSPFSNRGSTLTSFDPANFYHKNQEWAEKVKTETLSRGDVETQKRHNPEPRKPRQKVSPLTAIDAIRSQKLFVTRNLEALKSDIDYKDSSNNKKLKTYLEYDWDDGRLREEIGEIEELYSYVKGLVKKRLDQNTGEPVDSVHRDSINAEHPRGRASSYSYKHKSPNARAASLNNSIDNIRVQTLKKAFNKKEALSSLNPVDRERPHNDKLETSVHSESNLRDLMKNKETKKLTIRDNHYVIIDN